MKTAHLVTVAAAFAAMSLAAACGSSTKPSASPSSSATTNAANAATGTPIPFGFVNFQTDPQAGDADPDTWDGARAAENYINQDLGGVGGRPFKLTLCGVNNTPESGTACGSQLVSQHPVGVIAGISAVADSYMPDLTRAGLPYVTINPLSASEYTSANSFAMNGGGASAGPAFALYVLNTLKAKKVVVAYIDLPTGQATAQNFIQKPLEAKGVKVNLIPVPEQAPDMAPILNAIVSQKPDAAFLLAANPQCIGLYKALAATPTSIPIFYPANCASSSVISSGGPGAAGAYFPLLPGTIAEPGNSDYEAYAAQMTKDFPKTSLSGAAVTGFSAVMDTYEAIKGSTGPITAEAVTSALKSAVGAHAWFGGTFTCDGKQLPGLPSVCSTAAVIGKLQGGKLTQITSYSSIASVFGAS